MCCRGAGEASVRLWGVSMLKALKALFRSRLKITNAQLDILLSLVDAKSQPNLNALTVMAREIEPLSLSIKQYGYSLARRLAEIIPPPMDPGPRQVGLHSKLSVQDDLESEWARHWFAVLGVPLVYHRKLWELCFVLQALFEGGAIRAGARGLGFGCGTEIIPSYLAAQGITVTATDLPAAEAGALGWADTKQHTAHLDEAFHSHLVDRALFDALVGLRYVDMNHIPADLVGYDFCWSICALEHLGSIQQGLDFIANSLDTLVPGGIAVHTTEFNIRSDGPTIDNWPTVLFQRQHFEALAARLRSQGHTVAPLDFNLGGKPMDQFVDLPPWAHQLPADINEWLGPSAHLKLSVDGFVSTCFGIIVRRKAEA